MKFVVTGAAGFLGWHTRCALRTRGYDDIVSVDRQEWSTAALLREAVAGADVVMHFAGSNRADDRELREGTVQLVRTLTTALDESGTAPASLVFADSIHAGNGSPFGDGKLAAASHLTSWGRATGVPVVDARLPNLFGEHGRPHYNSVVATFCHELAHGRRPVVEVDREVPLLHVHDAADLLIDAAIAGGAAVAPFYTRPVSVSTLLARLTDFHDAYASGDIPDVSDPFDLALFNTYRSYTFPSAFPIRPSVRSDERGDLFEAVRVRGGESHVFCSTTRPGHVRGQHFHVRKIERFLVLSGTAQIALRRMFTDQVVRFDVSGDQPAIVDMPTLWAHSITNTGDDDLTTLFWAHEILRPGDPDTFPEVVERHEGARC